MNLRHPLVRYTLYQLPGFGIVVVIGYLALHFDWLDSTWVAFGIAGWIVKDALLYPLLRKSYELPPPHHKSGHVGKEAITVGVLDPAGQVRVEGTIWRAKSLRGRIEAGAHVEIHDESDLTLFVR